MVWFLDILKEDSATWLILQLHQFLVMFPLLMRLVKKVFGKGLQSRIIKVKVFWRTCEGDAVILVAAEERRRRRLWLRGTGAVVGALVRSEGGLTMLLSLECSGKSQLIRASASQAQAIPLQPLNDSFASAARVAEITGAHHHAQLIFIFFVETGFHHVGHAGLELLTSALDNIRVDERVENRCENGIYHIAHDVEVEGQVSPVSHIGYGNGCIVGAHHQEVGAAGGEGFGASFLGVDVKHRGQDVGVGKKHQEKWEEGHHHGNAEAHEGLRGGVRAGGLNHSQVVTEAVVDVGNAVKCHLGGLYHCRNGQEERSEPGTGCQDRTGLWGHEDRVVQWEADSHIVVIGHDHQDEGFRAGEAVE
ncbi:hypothetical protein AAY473_002966 [Plecturocebus cupreus]